MPCKLKARGQEDEIRISVDQSLTINEAGKQYSQQEKTFRYRNRRILNESKCDLSSSTNNGHDYSKLRRISLALAASAYVTPEKRHWDRTWPGMHIRSTIKVVNYNGAYLTRLLLCVFNTWFNTPCCTWRHDSLFTVPVASSGCLQSIDRRTLNIFKRECIFFKVTREFWNTLKYLLQSTRILLSMRVCIYARTCTCIS